MRPIDEILVEHYAFPTLITPTQKEQFAHYISLAEDHRLEDFYLFLNQVDQAFSPAKKSLCHVVNVLANIIENALLEIENILSRDAKSAVLFSQHDSEADLTQKHLKLILGLEARLNDVANAALLLSSLRMELESYLCSPMLATDITLRHIALLEGCLGSPIESAYRNLAHGNPPPLTKVSDGAKTLEEHVSIIEQALTDLILTSSRAITAVNKQEQPQTYYLNLLRTEQIRLHDIKGSLKRVQSEVQHVKIPDVL